MYGEFYICDVCSKRVECDQNDEDNDGVRDWRAITIEVETFSGAGAEKYAELGEVCPKCRKKIERFFTRVEDFDEYEED